MQPQGRAGEQAQQQGGAGEQAQPQGREKRYSFAPEPLDSVSAWIAAVGAQWDARLARLKAFVEDENESEG